LIIIILLQVTTHGFRQPNAQQRLHHKPGQTVFADPNLDNKIASGIHVLWIM